MSPERARVFIATQEDDLISALQMLLTAAGHEVVLTAISIDDALEKVRWDFRRTQVNVALVGKRFNQDYRPHTLQFGKHTASDSERLTAAISALELNIAIIALTPTLLSRFRINHRIRARERKQLLALLREQ